MDSNVLCEYGYIVFHASIELIKFHASIVLTESMRVSYLNFPCEYISYCMRVWIVFFSCEYVLYGMRVCSNFAMRVCVNKPHASMLFFLVPCEYERNCLSCEYVSLYTPCEYGSAFSITCAL